MNDIRYQNNGGYLPPKHIDACNKQQAVFISPCFFTSQMSAIICPDSSVIARISLMRFFYFFLQWCIYFSSFHPLLSLRFSRTVESRYNGPTSNQNSHITEAIHKFLDKLFFIFHTSNDRNLPITVKDSWYLEIS